MEPFSITAGAYAIKALVVSERVAEIAKAAEALYASAGLGTSVLPGEAAALVENAGVPLDRLAEVVGENMGSFSPLRVVKEAADDPDDRKALGGLASVGEAVAARPDIPSTVEKVNGKNPHNAHLAGLDVPLSEFNGIKPGSEFYDQTIHWTEQGFPDFSPWVYETAEGKVCDVVIQPTGSHKGDAAAANEACGLERTPPGYSWHHHEETGRMQLVPSEVHGAVGHTGGFSMWGKEAMALVEAPGVEAAATEPGSLWDRFIGMFGLGGK